MDWNKLFGMQQKLDAHIIETHQLAGRDVFEEKILALFVELGELANETRCFKFWSTKKRNDAAIILEEYVDNIHFILSLGIDRGFDFDQEVNTVTNKEETIQFNTVFATALQFKTEPTQTNYEALFISYLELGILLGFSNADIIAAYIKKNEINFQRQADGY